MKSVARRLMARRARPGGRCSTTESQSPQGDSQEPIVPATTRKTVLTISGMKCNQCREELIDALGRVDGVIDVAVSLIRATAAVTHTAMFDTSVLISAVEKAGCAAMLVTDARTA